MSPVLAVSPLANTNGAFGGASRGPHRGPNQQAHPSTEFAGSGRHLRRNHCRRLLPRGTTRHRVRELRRADRGRRLPARPGRVRQVGRGHCRRAHLMATRRERPRTGGRASRLGDRLLITARARKALRRLCADAGRQHLVLTWPGGVNYLPAAMHDAGPYDVVVGHVARCPIYADLRQLDLFRTQYMLIDVNDCAHPAGRPLLMTTHHPQAHKQAGRPATLVASAGGAAIGRRLRRARRRRTRSRQPTGPVDTRASSTE